MQLRYDEEDDAIYLRLSDRGIIESEEVRPGIVLDYDEDGVVVGIEVLRGRLRPESVDSKPSQTTVSISSEAIAPHTSLVRSLLEVRQRLGDEGVPFITTWEDLDREIADRRGVPAHDRAG